MIHRALSIIRKSKRPKRPLTIFANDKVTQRRHSNSKTRWLYGVHATQRHGRPLRSKRLNDNDFYTHAIMLKVLKFKWKNKQPKRWMHLSKLLLEGKDHHLMLKEFFLRSNDERGSYYNFAKKVSIELFNFWFMVISSAWTMHNIWMHIACHKLHNHDN